MITEASTIVTLKKGEGRTVKNGGLWIFDNEIASIAGRFTNGDIVIVHDFDGYPLGKGYINQNSKIRIRLLTRKVNEAIDVDFINRRVRRAWEYRKDVMAGGNDTVVRLADDCGVNAKVSGGLDSTCDEAAAIIRSSIGTTGRADLNCCRVIFGEADMLPGIVIDKYSDVLVVQALTLGIDRIKNEIVNELRNVLLEDGIVIRGGYERSDAAERKKEGLALHKGFIGDGFDTDVKIVENGIVYTVDVVNGQKTGFFLDQKYNRMAIRRLCRGKRVLDCFTHMGTFALNAAAAGAREVTGLDISDFAVRQATENAKRNGLDAVAGFVEANVLDELPRLYEKGERYDVVILDPPAFTKSKEATKGAIKGYREINMKGLKLVNDGGYFISCSCSHFMTEELLARTIREAARTTHKTLKQIEFRTQGPDHPILWSGDGNSYYLKFYIFQVCEER